MSKSKKEWTIILLVSAKSNLYYEMITAINEIYQIGSTDEVNFLIIYDGLQAGKFKPEFAEPSLYYVDSEFPFIVAQPEKIYTGYDLTNPDHLAEILVDAKTKFPAKKFGFIYKGHGKSGAVDISDGETIEKIIRIPKDVSINDLDALEAYLMSTNSDSTYLGYFDLKGMYDIPNNHCVLAIFKSKIKRSLSHFHLNEALKKAFPKKNELAFIFMDCCWAMQIENAYTYVGTSENYIASADEMPALGIGYVLFCQKITSRPTLKPDELSNLLVSVFFTNKYDDYDTDNELFRKIGVSLTYLDTSPLTDFMKEFASFCQLLQKNMDKYFIILGEARNKCLDFTYHSEEVFGVYNIDLIWFLDNLRLFNHICTKDDELDQKILTLIRQLTLYLRKSYMGSNYKDALPGRKRRVCNGISISFPSKKAGMEDDYTQISDKKSKEVAFYTESQWPAMLKVYFATVEKYKNDFSEMTDEIKRKASIFLKKQSGRDFSGHGLEKSEFVKYVNQDIINPKPNNRWGNYRAFTNS